MTCCLPSDRVAVLAREAFAPFPIFGVALVSGGHAAAQASAHELVVPESAWNRYRVRPFELTRIFPRSVFADANRRRLCLRGFLFRRRHARGAHAAIGGDSQGGERHDCRPGKEGGASAASHPRSFSFGGRNGYPGPTWLRSEHQIELWSQVLRPATTAPLRVEQRCVRGSSQGLKCTAPVAQPTPCTQTFWTPVRVLSMSCAETIMLAWNDSSVPSPAR